MSVKEYGDYGYDAQRHGELSVQIRSYVETLANMARGHVAGCIWVSRSCSLLLKTQAGSFEMSVKTNDTA